MKRMLLLGVALAAFLPRSANAVLLWTGDANKGTGVFGNLQAVNGTISVVDDPTYGKVFKIVCNDNGDTKARSEVSRMAGVSLKNDGDYYVAWHSKWGPLPTNAGKWQVLSQIHLDGPGSGGATGPVPFGLSVPGDGMMHFNAQDPSGVPTSIWDHPLPLDSWHKYVLHTKMGETLETGYCEVWFDGVKQTLTNGQEKMPCSMAHANAGSYWKWGVYRSGAGGAIGQSVHYLYKPMMGTTYADVADGDTGGGGGTGGGDAGAAPADAAADFGAAVDARASTGGTSGDGGGAGGVGTGGSSVGGGMGGAGASGDGTGGTPPPSNPPKPDGGCGCHLAPSGGRAAWLALPLLLSFALRRRRR